MYQGQGHVITPHSICGMMLLVPVLDIVFTITRIGSSATTKLVQTSSNGNVKDSNHWIFLRGSVNSPYKGPVIQGVSSRYECYHGGATWCHLHEAFGVYRTLIRVKLSSCWVPSSISSAERKCSSEINVWKDACGWYNRHQKCTVLKREAFF